MKSALTAIRAELDAIREAGTWREERIITTPQRARIDTTARDGVLNMCANNYLGLSAREELIEAAKESYDKWGFGLSSVRFICGTQEIHKELEKRIARFVGTDDAILYSSCFDANGGLFETLLTAEDAVISDELNHASIIDGVRLCKAKRYRYKNNDMADLREKLVDARESGCKKILIATDGVFSMDGYIADLKSVCDLADEFDALVMVDDSHSSGFMGEHGRGTSEFCGVLGRVTSSPVPSARHSAVPAAASPLRVRRSWICCVREAVPTSSPTLWHLPSALPPSRPSTCWRSPPHCVTRCTRTPLTSAQAWRSWASICSPVSIPSSLLCSMIPRSLTSLPAACWRRACTWWHSAILWCPRARIASAPRSAQATARKIWTLPSAASAR